MKYPSFILTFCFFLFSLFVSAQYYETGQDPGSIKWLQIKTDRFKVIYPEAYGQKGIDFVSALDKSYSMLVSLYPEMKFRIPVIIHNYTTMSNGYVAWAPSRMEIYPTPEQNSIPLDPNMQLAIHELTHVLQMESLNKGFTKVMSFVAGQQIPGLVSSLLPLWFLEGDAVFSESVLTNSGRGRTPSFQRQLKAIMLEKGKMYNYDKILNGSYRDFIPDHYRTGYQMAAWSYARYDSSLWKKALNLTANIPFTINPVNLSLRKSASLTKKRLFIETFDTLKTIWTDDDSKYESINYETANPPRKERYVSYYSPVYAGKDSIVAVRTSLSDPPSFVLINPSAGSEKRIHTPGYGYPWNISYGNGRIVWVEAQADPRWENRSWSVIKIMDLKLRIVRQLSRKTRYMAASISPDGSRIAAVRSSVNDKNDLVIINVDNGNILEEIAPPGNAYLQKPQWDDKGKKISTIFLTEAGEGIMSCDVDSRVWNILVEASNNDLQSTFLRNDSLFFISSISGTDNVYLQDNKGNISCLTKSRFGASDLNITGNAMLFTDYSSAGNNICSSGFKNVSSDRNPVTKNSSYLISRFRSYPVRPEASPDKVYTPEPYRKWKHLLRFHSWMPFYADIDELKSDPTSLTPGLTLMTQNDLSTLISTVGYEYSDDRHKLHASIRWVGWYPGFETRIDYGNRPLIDKMNQTVPDPEGFRQGLAMKNTLYLPLFFQGGSFSQYLLISASGTFVNDHIFLKDKGYYDKGQNQMAGRIYFSNYFRSAVRDIYPRWAQIADLSYTSYPFDKELYGNIITAKTAFYFPGLFRNNGIKLRLEAEKQNPERFLLRNKISFSRGYEDIISKRISFLSADYFMPLVYPDFNISSFFYLTRIRADLFYDITRGTGNYTLTETEEGMRWVYNEGSESFKSFGLQLLSDFYVLRIPYMITAGVEASWREIGNPSQIRLIFNVDIYGMNIGRNKIRRQIF